MTFPLVSPATGVDKGFEGDERTRTAASVPTTLTHKRLQGRTEAYRVRRAVPVQSSRRAGA